MNELELSHFLVTAGGLATVLTPLFAFYGKAKTNIIKGLVTELEVLRLKDEMLDDIDSSAIKQAEFNKSEIERLSKWINDNDKETKHSIQKILDHLLDAKN